MIWSTLSHIPSHTFVQICITFGSEEVPGQNHRKTEIVKTFLPPFRTENYRTHLQHGHPKEWAVYQVLEASQKKAHFNSEVPFSNQIVACLDPTSVNTKYELEASIVDVIIGDML